MERTEDPSWPLRDLRILDLSSEIAGPYAAKLFADAGADVIKIEAPDAPDPLRRWTASHTPLEPERDGALFQFLNASKRAIALDLERASERADLLALARHADLVVESFGPGGLAERGIDWPVLVETNPSVSLLSISPWGLEGPYAARPSTEFTLQAATGTISYRGLPDRKPVCAGGRIGEWAAGSYGAAGALSAVRFARAGAAGQHVDVSTYEAMLLCLTVYHDLNGQWVEGPLPRAIEIPSIEPTADGWVGLCAITGQQWTDFCAMLGRQDIGEDMRFLDGRTRMAELPRMQEMMHAWTKARTTEEVIETAALLRIPAAPVGNGRTLPEMDQMIARGVFEKNPGGFIQPRAPYRLERNDRRPPAAAPRIDEHGAEIRAELIDASPPETAPITRDPQARPLSGLRVVDFSAFWAGPLATSYLADMGADVVKIESIQRPDGMRFAGAIPKEALWEWSPVFHGANPGKRDVTLQLDHDEGMALVHALIRKSDVLIENYSARVLERFGLGWEQVRAINPQIIMLRMPAFGLDGPWRDRPGFAMTVEQVSGLAWITGYRDMPLVMRGTCDPLGGMHAVFALQLALAHRERTGEGQLVELPLVEVAINLAAEQVVEYSAYGALLMRDENRGPVSAPQGVYETAAEGELVAIAIPGDAEWRALVALMGQPDWATPSALDSAEGRRARHDEIDRALESWLRAQPTTDLLERLHAAGIAAEYVVNPHFVHPHPQLDARGFFQLITHPTTGPTRYPGLPMRFSGLPRALHTGPPPTLGQHNEAILCGELGVSPDDYARLLAEGVIGTRPSFM